MKQKIAILGSTGSIGTQTLDVAKVCGLSVVALAAHKNVDLLEKQAREFSPLVVAAADLSAAILLKNRLSDTNITVLGGEEGILAVATLAEADVVVTAMVGIAGLIPTMAAISAKKTIALANKETLVCAGSLVMKEAKKQGVSILPVDSEHSAIFQCLQGNEHRDVKKIILTASGGPFFGKTFEELKDVTLAQALKHPNWSMGAKVTIDSSTLMNKGLEFLEAMALFDLPPEQIDILVHRESIIHSMVEYYDNSVMAQLGTPDMRLPIQYALTYPRRLHGAGTTLDLLTSKALTFASPDEKAFPCLALAKQAAKTGGTAPAIMNGANEIAVERFLKGEVGFLDIPAIVAETLGKIAVTKLRDVDSVFVADAQAREVAKGIKSLYLR